MARKLEKGINDLETLYPEIAKQWDYDNNDDLKPSDFFPGSNINVYWKCPKGHSYKAKIYNRIHAITDNQCPVCRNYSVLPGYNDLATTHPQLLEEWDFEKNKIDPHEIHAGVQTKVWWKCKKYGHSYNARVQTRAFRNSGCPICLNQTLLKGFNDVGTLYPDIYKYWDYENNNGKTPEDYIGTYSNKVIFLRCEKGHLFKTRVNEFCRGQRCPICSGKQVLVGFNDLATTHPDLALQWDYEKNGEFTPQMITHGSDKRAWWKCEKGHSWDAVISSRVSGKGCPVCSREFQTSFPEKAIVYYLLKQFPDLEENVHLSFLGKRELDIYIPSKKLAVEYDGCNWHSKAENDLKKDKLCSENGITLIRVREDGCATYKSTAYFVCAPRNHGNVSLLQKPINEMIEIINNLFSSKIPLIKSIDDDISKINEQYYTYTKSNSLALKDPELSKEWNYSKNGTLTPDMISLHSNQKVWWVCCKGHEWLANVESRAIGNGCPYCYGRYVLYGFNDLYTKYPEIAKQWDYEKNLGKSPKETFCNTNTKVWWKCEHGHSWKAAVSSRTRLKTGCPVCSGLVPEKGINDFETLYPDLAKEWDYDKNGNSIPSDYLPGSEKVVWWKCPRGHSYDTQIAIRAKMGCNCPICSNKRVLKGYNDLETLHPELAKEWDYEKNGDLKPSDVGGGGGSHKDIWWKCEKGHSWKTKISTRIGLHTGCPQCAIERSRKKD